MKTPQSPDRTTSAKARKTPPEGPAAPGGSGESADAAPTIRDPFANDHEVLTLGELTVENGTDKVAVYGSLDVTRDRSGLTKARALKATFDAIVQALESAHDLPDAAAPPDPTRTVRNPFA